MNDLTVGAVVLCRLDSQRLPGKVMADVLGRPLLWYVLTRCFAVASIGQVIVATSDRAVDDPIYEYCASQGIRVFRGPGENVAGRMLFCAEDAGLDYFFRINADSPCLEPWLLEKAVAQIGERNWDFITNLYPRSFPYGVSVELIKSATYRKIYPSILQSGQREHPTQYLYQHLDLLIWRNIIREGKDLSSTRLTVDTVEDLVWFRNLAVKTQDRWSSIGHEEIVANYCELRVKPELTRKD